MPLIAHHIAAKRTASWQCARQGLMPSVADPFAEKRTALVTMCKAMPESQVLLTIDAGSCHGISKLENVPRVLRVPHVPLASGKARSTHHKAHSPKQKPFANGNVQGKA